ncbi:MAG: hypothetical protein NT175_07885 [Bacteroidetes bacterium]|nr:hypothetical protein [Bacteroidota bacterium]
MATIKDLDTIPIEVIQEFRETKTSKIIPTDVQRYIIHLDRSFELLQIKSSLRSVALQLMGEFKEDKLSFTTARRRINDAVIFFNVNSGVKNEEWDSYYADRFEDLANKALDARNYTETRRCMERAHTLRTKRDENAIRPEDLRIKDNLINPNISPEQLGLKKINLKKLWEDSKDLINGLNLDSIQKNQLLKETAETLDVDNSDDI